ESLLQPAGQGGTFRFDEATREFHARVGDRRVNRHDERGAEGVPTVGGEIDVALGVGVVGATESRVVGERAARVPGLSMLGARPGGVDREASATRGRRASARAAVVGDDVDLRRKTGEALMKLQALAEADAAGSACPGFEALRAQLSQLAGVATPARAAAPAAA